MPFPAIVLEVILKSRVTHFVIRDFFLSFFLCFLWKETSSNVIALFHLSKRFLNGSATSGCLGTVTA